VTSGHFAAQFKLTLSLVYIEKNDDVASSLLLTRRRPDWITSLFFLLYHANEGAENAFFPVRLLPPKLMIIRDSCWGMVAVRERTSSPSNAIGVVAVEGE